MTCSCICGCTKCDPENYPAVSDDDDPVLVAINRAKPFLDAGWEVSPADQVEPSMRIRLRYFVLSTNHFFGIRAAQKSAAAWVEAMLEVARDRYRRGYHANPYGLPVVRPC